MNKLFGIEIEKCSFDEHLIGIVFFLSILLPHVGVLYLANPIILLILGCKYNSKRYRPATCTFAVVLLIISFLWNMISGIPIDNKSIVRLIYIVEIFLFFPFCASNCKIPNIYIYAVLILILISQICCIYGITAVSNIFDVIYPYGGEDESMSNAGKMASAANATSVIQLQDIRFGGLFHNSNQLMKYVSLCGIVFSIENFDREFKQVWPFLVLLLVSAFFAGSRTGFFIVVLTLAFWATNKKSNNVSFKTLFITGGILLFIYYIISVISPDFRVLKLGEGSHDSIGTKFYNLQYYWNVVDSVRALAVGNVASSTTTIRELYGAPFSIFDSEWGDLFYCYGLFFCIVYVTFLIYVVKSLNGYYKIAALCLLWIVSSTVLGSFRTSFAFLFILSKYYIQSKVNQSNDL